MYQEYTFSSNELRHDSYSACPATGSNETLDYKDLASYHATRLSTDRRRKRT